MRILTLTLLILEFLNGQASRLLSEMQAEHAIQVAVVVPSSQFTAEAILALSRSFLNAHTDKSLIRYVIFTDMQDGHNYLGGLGVTDWEFPAWRHAYLAENLMPPATAEMIRIADRSSIRIRFQDGTIKEYPIDGKSPFDLTLDGYAARLMGVTFHPAGRRRKEVPDHLIHLFIQTTGPWDKQVAEKLSRFLRARTSFPWLEISMEDGWWFAGETYYPVYNRFLPHLEPPTFDEFKTHTRFYCIDRDGQCNEFGPAH